MIIMKLIWNLSHLICKNYNLRIFQPIKTILRNVKQSVINADSFEEYEKQLGAGLGESIMNKQKKNMKKN